MARNIKMEGEYGLEGRTERKGGTRIYWQSQDTKGNEFLQKIIVPKGFGVKEHSVKPSLEGQNMQSVLIRIKKLKKVV